MRLSRTWFEFMSTVSNFYQSYLVEFNRNVINCSMPLFNCLTSWKQHLILCSPHEKFTLLSRDKKRDESGNSGIRTVSHYHLYC